LASQRRHFEFVDGNVAAMWRQFGGVTWQQCNMFSMQMLTDALVLRGHRGTIKSVSLPPDGTQIVSGSTDATIRVWDACSRAFAGALIGELLKAHIPLSFVTSISFSPNSLRVVTAFGDMVCVQDLHVQPTVADQLKIQSHIDMVFSFAFRVLSDPEFMVSVGVEHTVAPASPYYRG
jgi:WD40 repeat protein